MPKNTSRRSKSQIARDRAVMARMYLHGALQIEIAEKLGLSQGTVSRDLKMIQAEWLEGAEEDVKKIKARELARIDELERTYWQAWADSCEDAEMERAKQASGASGEMRAEIIKEKRGQSGNPSFLAGVERCIKMRIDVVGLEAPKKTELTGEGGGEVVIKVVYDDDEQRTD